jgi:hypothetical protein
MKHNESHSIFRPTAIGQRVLLLLLMLLASSSACDRLAPPHIAGEQPGAAAPSAQKGLSPGYQGAYKPVGFVNHGTVSATVMPCTWTPAGAPGPAPPPSASTISTHSGAPGLWPNSSRFLSLPLGTYTWCIQWDQGDQDGDGKIDYFYFVDDHPVTLSEDDRDELESAVEVSITVPPGPGTQIYSGTCDQAPACQYGGGVTAYLVSEALKKEFAGGGSWAGVEYDAAAIALPIDPAVTGWIAWNNTPGVTLGRPARPGEAFLGPGGFGTDDYIELTVVNPAGEPLTVELDHNDPTGRWEGPQNVIFGSAGSAPDVFRRYPDFADPPGQEFFIDEQGSHNAIFSAAGDYEFRFSFRNRYTASASHPDIYLLVSTP